MRFQPDVVVTITCSSIAVAVAITSVVIANTRGVRRQLMQVQLTVHLVGAIIAPLKLVSECGKA